MLNLNFLLNYSDWGIFFLRLIVATIFIYHGWPKLKNQNKFWILPAGGAVVIGLIECLSGLGLVLGIMTQLAALLLCLVMLGAIIAKKFTWHVPFSSSSGGGWEFDLILLSANIVILVTGGGVINLSYFFH